MVTDQQVRRLKILIQTEKTQAIAASKAGMDKKTARKYLKSGKLPSQCKKKHNWQTRKDPLAKVWREIEAKLEINPFQNVKILFKELQQNYPGTFPDVQLRTLQRRVKAYHDEKKVLKKHFYGC